MKIKKETTRLLIGYTISDDQARDAFRNKLANRYKKNLVWGNESMYKLRGVLPGNLETALIKIIKDIGEGSFVKGDFIKWYYAPNFGNYPRGQNKDSIVEKTLSFEE